MLAAVDTVRNAESKIKVEGFQMLVTKEMPLDHPELVDGLPANLELHRGSDSSQLEKLRMNRRIITERQVGLWRLSPEV